MDVYGQPREEGQRSDRGVERSRVRRFPQSPIRATTGNAPKAPDPTFDGELARSDSLGRGQALKLLWIAVGRPQDLDVHEEFHRGGSPSTIHQRIEPLAGLVSSLPGTIATRA